MYVSPLGSLFSNLGTGLSIRGPRQVTPTPVGDQGSSLRDLARRVLDLREGVDRLRRSIHLRSGRSGRTGGVASASSTGSLGFSLQVSFTTLTTEEVNTVPTSFGPRGPSFTRGSTATPLVGGIYDGSLGDDQLTFRVKKDATVGSDDITFQVKDSAGRKLEDVKFKKSEGPGTVKTLSNGLTLSLSAGDVDKHDTFVVDVFATVGSVVEPDNPFNGIGNSDPNFDPGLSVTAGSFDVNGVTIDVFDDDTLNGVLTRITASAANVYATFDAATESVVLTQKTPGAHPITVTGDSSGFVAASKLSTANQVLGSDTDLQRAIAYVPALVGINNGTFGINGVQFDVDTGRDSLQDVFDRINSSEAGVTAGFDAATNQVSITSNTAGAPLELDNGSSNLFDVLEIVEGHHEPPAGRKRGGQVFANEREFQKQLAEFGKELQGLFTETFAGLAAGSAEGAKGRIRNGVRDVFSELLGREGGDRLRSGLGIDFFFEDVDDGVLRVDDAALSSAMRGKGRSLGRFLLGKSSNEDGGLLGAFDDALERIGKDLRRQLDRDADRGLRVDLLA